MSTRLFLCAVFAAVEWPMHVDAQIHGQNRTLLTPTVAGNTQSVIHIGSSPRATRRLVEEQRATYDALVKAEHQRILKSATDALNQARSDLVGTRLRIDTLEREGADEGALRQARLSAEFLERVILVQEAILDRPTLGWPGSPADFAELLAPSKHGNTQRLLRDNVRDLTRKITDTYSGDPSRAAEVARRYFRAIVSERPDREDAENQIRAVLPDTESWKSLEERVFPLERPALSSEQRGSKSAFPLQKNQSALSAVIPTTRALQDLILTLATGGFLKLSRLL